MRCLWVTVGLLAASFSAQAFDTKWFVSAESGAHGDRITTTLLNAVTIGNSGAMAGSWIDNTGANDIISTNFFRPLFWPAHIDGTNYYGEVTRCLEFDLQTDGHLIYNLTPDTNGIVLTCWFEVDVATSSTVNRDLIILKPPGSPTEFWVMQLDGNGSQLYLLAHSSTEGGGGEQINISPLTPYHICVAGDTNRGVGLWVHDTNMNLVGFSDLIASSNTNGVTQLEIGNVNPHGGFADGKVRFDNITMNAASPASALKRPIGLPTYRYVSGVDGSDSDPGTNWASAFATIDFAWDNATNSDTVIVVTNGFYSGAITPSRSGTPGDKIWIKAATAGMTTNSADFTLTGISNVCFSGLGFLGSGSGETDRAISFASANRIELWHCIFTNYFDYALYSDDGTYGNNTIAIGDTFYGKTNYGDGHMVLIGTNNLVGHLRLKATAEDFIWWAGQSNIFRNIFADEPMPNPSGGALAHVDLFQTGSGISTTANNNYNLMEANLYHDAVVASDDHHISNASNTTDADPYGDLLFRRNVAFNIGTVVHTVFSPGGGTWSRVVMVNETYVLSSRHSSQANDSGGVNFDDGGTIKNNIAYKIWGTNATTPSVWVGAGAKVSDYNLFFDPNGSRTFISPAVDEANSVFNQDPLFIAPLTANFRLQSGSPARNVGGPLTTVASASASGTTFKVLDASYFRGDNPAINQYNGSLVVGDTITVGTDVVQILSIDGTNITTTTSFTWATNDVVYLGNDTTPDMGALPFSHVPLTGLTASKSGATYTATVTGDFRLVVFFVDDIPQKVAYAGEALTFDYLGPSTVTARAYALYASETLWVDESAAGFPAGRSRFRGLGLLP